MVIKKISISCFRCFSNLDLEFSELNNFFFGPNGSGKTSVLEALYFCSTGRSFKSSNKNLCIQNKQNSFQLKLETINRNRIKILKTINKSIYCEIDGQKASSVDLFRTLPSTLLDSKIFSMFIDTPQYRRKILDRCLMAADKGYTKDFFSFHKALKQRNAALKQNSKYGLDMWSEIFASSGSHLSKKREELFQRTKKVFFSFSKHFSDKRVLDIINSLDIVFYKGWQKEYSLNKALQKSLDTDSRRQITSAGPHKADIKFLSNNEDIKYILSRGEQKFLSILWCLSMHKTLSDFYNSHPFLIIDDIHSELDNKFYAELVNFLPKTSNQLFFSDINNPFDSKIDYQYRELKKFHVEQFNNAKKTK